jgi:hypothetical protein
MSASTQSSMQSNVYILFDRIIRFFNEWGNVFEEGSSLDPSQSLLDTCSGYSTMIIQQASNFQSQMEETHQVFESRISSLQTQLQSQIGKQVQVWNDNIQGCLKTSLENTLKCAKEELQEYKDNLCEELQNKIRCVIKETLEEELFKNTCRPNFCEQPKICKSTQSEKSIHINKDKSKSCSSKIYSSEQSSDESSLDSSSESKRQYINRNLSKHKPKNGQKSDNRQKINKPKHKKPQKTIYNVKSSSENVSSEEKQTPKNHHRQRRRRIAKDVNFNPYSQTSEEEDSEDTEEEKRRRRRRLRKKYRRSRH